SSMVPTAGVYLRARVDRFLEIADIVPAAGEPFDEVGDFTRAELTASWFTTLGPSGRGFVAGGAGSTLDARPLSPYNFSLGGPFKLGALVPGALTGPKYLQVTTGYLHQFGQLPSLIGGPMFFGGWLESGSAFEDVRDASWTNNISTGVVLESILGPIFGAVSLDVDGGWRYYVAIGRLFR
ncbi:MAG TPA: hypothetical protein VIY56_17730, partial [Vicinamibacterales bacterium]